MRYISRRNFMKSGLSAAGLVMASGPLAFCSSRIASAEVGARILGDGAAISQKVNFEKMFAVFQSRIDLFGNDPENPKLSEAELKDPHTMKSYILDGARNMPGIYYESYVAPLINGLEPVLARNTLGTIETLAGAVYDHRAKSVVAADVRSFVALISSVYRSFLLPEMIPPARLAIPSTSIPPLATFRPETDEQHRISFTLPASEVKRLCGGNVAVVSLPSIYRKHPVLCWAAIAHEVGGHDILDAYRGLLVEIQQVVRREYYLGADPVSGSIETTEQFLGLIWQVWAEESASDVFAVMNVGPAYAYALIVFLAAMNDHYSRNEEGLNRQGVPKLRASTLSEYGKRNPLAYIGPHPPDILKLHVLLGAIDTLCLEDSVKKQYGAEIKRIAEEWCPDDKVVVRGIMQVKPGNFINVEQIHPRKFMEDQAYNAGKCIASKKFQSLNGHGVQDLETWDKADHYAMLQVSKKLLANQNESEIISYLGNDGQLVSGAIEALCRQPDLYDEVNVQLSKALARHFDSDPIWRITAPWAP